MWTVTRAITAQLVGLILVLLPASMLSGHPLAAQTQRTPHTEGAHHGAVNLMIHEGRLSLMAQEASLTAIFEAIGRQLSIDVVTQISEDERVTIAFEQLPLTEALKRFRPYVNYLVVEDAAEAPGTIRKLIVVSKRATGMPSLPVKEDGKGVVPSEHRRSEAPTSGAPLRPKPFSFEFDPTAVGERRR
jgi:hypothetical protein